MKLLYGTGNLAKLSAMRNRLEQLDIELIGLNDLRVEGKNVPEVKEDGNTPLENARLKAMAYYEAFQIPVFSCDSGLYFDNVPNEVQPGVHVRNVNGKCLSDDEMIDYYSGLVKAYGNLVARYRNAICFVMDNTHIYEAIMSYNYGAGNRDRVKKAFFTQFTICTIFTGCFWLIMLLFPKIFAGIFSNNTELITYTAWALRIYMAGIFSLGFQVACQQSFMALGQAKVSLLLACLRKLILLIPLIFILPHFIQNKVFAVFLAEPISDILAAIITTSTFFSQFNKILDRK